MIQFLIKYIVPPIVSLIAVYLVLLGLAAPLGLPTGFLQLGVLLGVSAVLTSYYYLIKNNIDKSSAIATLEKRLQQHECQKLNGDSKKIQSMNEIIRDEIKEKDIYIELPLNARIPISYRDLIKMRQYIEELIQTMIMINEASNDYFSGAAQELNDINKLNGYLTAIVSYISKVLFKPDDARIHFRFYSRKDNSFKKLVTSFSSDHITYSLSPIPFGDSNMISEAFKIKRSLIKSLNPDFHFTTGSEEKWPDYITAAFSFDGADKPCLSIGISVCNEEIYKDKLYFLNHIRFERIIYKILEIFNKEINIQECVSRLDRMEERCG